MSRTTGLAPRWQESMMANYGTPAIQISHGAGCTVTDVDGNDYLDFVAGIAVSSLGHAHPAIVEAVTAQVGRIAHTSNLYAHEPGLQLAERLRTFIPDDAQVFFCQDGATAMEAALKIVRKRARQQAPDGSKQVIVAAQDSFHGRTFGALAVTGSQGKRDPFVPFGHEVRFVPYGDADALAAAVDDSVAAIVLEPIQGEAGVIVPPEGYLRAARALATDRQCLLVVDEVQSGIGRTGEWLASVAEGVVPDIITLAKGLAGGLPIGAVIATGPARGVLVAGEHGSTFGGNPVSCAAALAVINTLESEGLLAHVRDWGCAFTQGVMSIEHPLISHSRGIGAWHAIVLTEPVASAVEAAARAAGFLVNAVRSDALRICPPLIVTEQQLHAFLAALPGILDAAQAGS